MSDLVVITFDDGESAEKALHAIEQTKSSGVLKVDDYAIILKDADGKISTKNRVDSGTAWGAGIGGVLGGMLMFMFPVAGIAIGAGGGALIGHMFNRHVDQDFVRQVQDELKPNGSALFLMLREGDYTGSSRALVAALEPFEGTLYQTSLSSEFEEQLTDSLK